MQPMTDKEIAEADAQMKADLRLAEEHRRERPSVSPGPITGAMDYGQSGTTMELAMGHLRESIPGGQRQRTLRAWLALKEATQQQERWLRMKGFL